MYEVSEAVSRGCLAQRDRRDNRGSLRSLPDVRRSCARLPHQPIPQSLQVRRPERAIVKAVPGAPLLPPDHAAVIRTHRTCEPDVAQGPQHRREVYAAARRRMCRLLEAPLARDADVATVREMDAVLRYARKAAYHCRQVLLGERAERPGAERHSVRRAVYQSD